MHVDRIPDKPYYTLGEVCQYARTQPYVLRFWEGEFPQLRPARGRSGQSVYTRRELDLVLRIKALLDDEERTICDARRLLDAELQGPSAAAAAERPAGAAAEAPERIEPLPPARHDVVPRGRYDDALEEIAHLRLELNDAQAARRRAESALKRSQERVERAATLIEALLGRLG